MTKWAEKKAELDKLYEACNQPKIASGDFTGILSILKKCISDSMAAVSISAIKVCGILGLKLKKDFEPYAKQLLVPIIYRFKEKKTQMTDESLVVLDNFLNCFK